MVIDDDGCQEQIHALNSDTFRPRSLCLDEMHSQSDAYSHNLAWTDVRVLARNMSALLCIKEVEGCKSTYKRRDTERTMIICLLQEHHYL